MCGALTIGLLMGSCRSDIPCPDTRFEPLHAAVPTERVVGSEIDPYQPGDLEVRTLDVAACDNGAPRALRIHTPTAPGTYAVVVFQHGFLSLNSAYDGILRQVASHGFVVVAPQMYTPGVDALLGRPSAAEEAVAALDVIAWLTGRLSALIGVGADTTRLGLAGHSRGGKVVWLVLSTDPHAARAVAGVDPVDGMGGPFGSQARAVDGPFEFGVPTLVIGTALGGACAPEGDNHEQFYAASTAPAWHIVALEHGHGDMLDDAAAEQAETVCASGGDREAMRRLTAGLLVAFLRGTLQDHGPSLGYLTDAEAAPTAIAVESR